MKSELGDLQRLKHVRQCISDLQGMLSGVDEDAFYRDTQKKYATERIFEIIGEAINNVSPDVLKNASQVIPWRNIVDFRNIVSHEYFRVDYTIVYEIATEKRAELKPVIEDLIMQLEK
jgi:uncharacterized protein with HEPN domain